MSSTANTTPIFPAKPQVGHQISPGTLNTTISGTSLTNTKVLITAAADGTRVDYVRAIPVASLASQIKLNLFVVNATNYYLIDEIILPICVVSTTSTDPVWEKFYENLILSTGMTLEFTATTSAGTNSVSVTAYGWDYTP